MGYSYTKEEIIGSIQNTIGTEYNNVLELIEDNLKLNLPLHYYIPLISSSFILSKTKYLLEQIISNVDLASKVSNIRFLLEELATLKIIKNNEKNLYLMYFSLYNQQLERLSSMIGEAEKEIKLLGQCENKDKATVAKTNAYIAKNRNMNREAIIKGLRDLNREIFDEIVNPALASNPIFFDYKLVNQLGFGFTKYCIDKQILSKYKSMFDEIITNRKELIDGFKSNEYISNLLGREKLEYISQWAELWKNSYCKSDIQKYLNQLRKELKEDKKAKEDTNSIFSSWNKKFIDAGLEAERNIIYEYTSSLIHCRAYSIFTSTECAEEEIKLLLKKTLYYAVEIVGLVREISQIEKYPIHVVLVD